MRGNFILGRPAVATEEPEEPGEGGTSGRGLAVNQGKMATPSGKLTYPVFQPQKITSFYIFHVILAAL